MHPNGIRRLSIDSESGKPRRCAPRSARRNGKNWLDNCTDQELEHAQITREENVTKKSEW